MLKLALIITQRRAAERLVRREKNTKKNTCASMCMRMHTHTSMRGKDRIRQILYNRGDTADSCWEIINIRNLTMIAALCLQR